ncbi:DUF6883 domain-containing protein [Planctomycetota bacterium]
MPIPNAELAVVPLAKIEEYLLNLLHPAGAPKARWFLGLGYDPSQPGQLADDLRRALRNGVLRTSSRSAFGVKFVVDGCVVSPSGKAVGVCTVWIVEPTDHRPRLVTAYPGEVTPGA